MRFVIAANYDLDPSKVAMHLLRHLAQLPIDAKVLMRSPLSGEAGPIETMAKDLCDSLSIPVEWRRAQPQHRGRGHYRSRLRDGRRRPTG